MTIERRLEQRRREVEAALRKILGEQKGSPPVLRRAMRYSVLAGGKRIRPALMLETCEVIGGAARLALPAACAMELIHTYSLVHDDLPCMDNADERRGKLTSHRMFGEANAVLCGDGLLTLAFELLTNHQTTSGVPPHVALEVTAIIARAAGAEGMVGGQVLDLEWMRKEVGARQLRRIHKMKTGALICASVEAGAVMGGASAMQRKQMRAYGERIGLAFQIVDDLLDVVGDPARLGKSTGDIDQGKVTFPSVFGIARSKRLSQLAADEAIAALQSFGERAEPLRDLARFIVHRQN